MNELEEIKARAAERREEFARNNPEYVNPAADDLDRAIAIAEERADMVDVGKTIGTMMVEVDGLRKERDEARAAALALREVIPEVYGPDDRSLQPEVHSWVAKVLADTAWLEEHR